MKKNRQQWELEGIQCASCARKIETAVQRMEGVQFASLDFANAQLMIEINENQDVSFIKNQIEQTMDRIEPGSRIKNHTNGEKTEDEAIEQALSVHKIALYSFGFISFILAVILPSESIGEIALFILSYLIFGHSVLIKSFKNVLKGQIFDENFLMTIASVGAFLIGEYPEASAVMLFYQIGELFQDYAVGQSRRSIKKLINIRPDFANLKTQNGFKRVLPSSVRVGDLIVVRPGERIPLDGFVKEGSSSLDTSPLTGESFPRDVFEGDEVLSGSINQSGALVLEVTKDFSHSTVSRILSLVEEASHKKAVTERFITQFAAWYTPVVVILAVLIASVPPLVMGERFENWLYRALIFLVISCPCALVISIPLGFFGGIGAASKRGILIKGGNYLEALAKVDTVVFDKTGTLTQGVFEVTQINAQQGFTKEKILEYAALAESYSTHPISASILKKFGSEPKRDRVTDYREIPGQGIKVWVEEKEVLCGNRRLLEAHGVKLNLNDTQKGMQVLLAIDGKHAGSLMLKDTMRADAKEAIRQLKGLGVKNTVILTGDQREIAEETGKALGVEKVYSELLPQDKVTILERLLSQQAKKSKLAFVGDGINDAAVITRADVGIAMGGVGSDAAIEAADVVIMNDEPSKVSEAIRIARKTRTVVYQNILLAVFVKVLVLTLGAGGMATMWEAVFADVGVALLAIFNAMRLMRSRDSTIHIVK